MMINPTRPPTTLPAITATFDFLDPEDDGDPVAEGIERVADLATKVGFKV